MSTSSQPTEDPALECDLLPCPGAELWNGPAPQSLRDRYHSADDDEGWRRWRKHLARRRKPQPLAKQFAGRRSPLTWAWPDELATEPPNALSPLGLATGPSETESESKRRLKISAASQDWTGAAAAWLDHNGADAGSVTGALEALSWAYELPALAESLPAALWWRLLARLVAIAGQAGGIDLEAQPLANQLLAGELPLVLARQFPELNPCHALAAAGSAALSRGIAELLDGEGLPQCRWLPIFRPLLACWTRARTAGGKRAWDSETEVQFVHAVGEAIRLSRVDGRQSLSSGTAGDWCPKLFKQALGLVDARALDRRARKMLPPGRKGAKTPARPDATAAVNGDWSELAVLQPGWQRGGPKLTVAYGENSTLLELEIGGRLIWSGPWQCDVQWQGRALSIDSPWEEVCWVSDDDADYVEIEARLSDGFRLQRQIMLARKDRVLFLGDAVLAPTPVHPSHPHAPDSAARLTYIGRLPLAEGVRLEPAAETREAWLVGKKSRLAVLPLALAEWRVDPRRGELSAAADQMVLTQSVVGQNLYVPLLIDLDRKRARRGMTWRQLTVADQRQVQKTDVAVGFRAQSGLDQWLVYRALGGVAARSVLGQNLGTEFMFARFNRDGSVSRLVEIE
ncbi:MAG TPA: hypothetical protein VHY91_22775 [Pirellulales bacterium]|jgi:hypothetical protein|nr:hypothetical protein [Pirellulales bacterium]